MRSLAIISHTPHYYNMQGEVVGLEPTLREINHSTQIFDVIFHIAPLYKSDPHKATMPYTSNKIIFVPIKPAGGKGIIKKFGILFYMPYNLYKIIKCIQKVEWIHFRAPTNLGLYVLPLLSIYKNKKKWIKYAGNWQQNSVPVSYKIQRWWLKKNIQNSAVTMNGIENNPGSHLLSFNNPCLTEKEIKLNKKCGLRKKFNDKLTFCFVGRLEKSKGFIALLEAIKSLRDIEWFEKLHCVGEFADSHYLEELNSNGKTSIKYHGVLDRLGLNKIYEDSHFIILPSESEGFPKVLIEASSYGCIPIVPPIDSILSNINEEKKNGIVLENISPQGIIRTVESLQKIKPQLSEYSKNAMQEVEKYSYEKYNYRILNEIIQD